MASKMARNQDFTRYRFTAHCLLSQNGLCLHAYNSNEDMLISIECGCIVSGTVERSSKEKKGNVLNRQTPTMETLILGHDEPGPYH